MRISKSPEERKKEIMDIAMGVFAKKGYEQTTMRDIAAAVGVVPGLCYRYFPSKQELFDAALQNYVAVYCQPLIAVLQSEISAPEDLLSEKYLLHTMEDGSGDYESFFHQKENESFHVLLSDQICRYMLPHLIEVFTKFNQEYDLKILDIRAFTTFCLYGISAILNDKMMTSQEKMIQMKEVLHRLVKHD